MTRLELLAAAALRLDGKSWEEIGERLGYAPSAVYANLRSRILFRKRSVPCVYPAISEVIARRCSGSINAFAARCGVSYSTMYAVLSGRASAERLQDIICAETGLSPDEAFRRKEE